MGFFDKLREFRDQITEVENTIYTNKQDFLEIYERNLQLEKEISERTNELDVTNQRMLTLQHIWDMMNSSKPLSSVFSTIVKTLSSDLGYLHSIIVQIKEKDIVNFEEQSSKYVKVITRSEDPITRKTDLALESSLENIELNYPKDGIFLQALSEKSIKQTTDFRTLIRSMMPNLPEDSLRKMLANPQSHSSIIIPIQTQEKAFGWLVVFSSRDEAQEAELGFLKLFAQQIELAITIADLFQVVKSQAVTDPLTTLFNRRYFEEFLGNEVTRAKRMKQPFTLIGIDLDHLKKINDNYGHTFGDIAIKAVADVLKKNARAIDVAARMGGEEFNLLLPGVDSAGGLIAAERIRSAIESYELEQIGTITASIGVATFFEHSSNIEELIELVDQAMYSAKRNGRNQVMLAKAMSEVSWQEVAMDTFVKILSKQKIPVTKEISEELCKKLSTPDLRTDSSPKDMLFSVADTLAKTYNPKHKKGNTKLKVKLATKMAKLFELTEEEVNKLKIATLLYDIGNLMLPQEILQKNGPLSEAEKAEIKKHPIIAAREILKPISEVQDIIPIIEHHHENWDGTGYPGKVSGEKIPLASQIILIIDAYFALTEPRSYRDALSNQEAIEIIKKDANTKWNESIVNEFVRIVESIK